MYPKCFSEIILGQNRSNKNSDKIIVLILEDMSRYSLGLSPTDFGSVMSLDLLYLVLRLRLKPEADF